MGNFRTSRQAHAAAPISARRSTKWAGLLLLLGSACCSVPALAGSVSYSYDALGRLKAAVYNSGSSTTTITYSYDAAGNRVAVTTNSP